MSMSMTLDEDRFWSKVDKSGDCWRWTAHLNTCGYGKFRYNKKSWTAQRISWMICYGKIPEGMLVCHRCDNPSCVNPDHLFLGTPKDNVRDCVSKGRRAPQCGEKNYNSKLTEPEVTRIRSEYKSGGVTLQELADKYGVNYPAIHKIIKRKTWKYVGG